jgi:NitT/TauT family transport system substrate-binding protein
MIIKLAENFRALFYAPFYAAQALDFYTEEGVDVQFFSTSAAGDAIAALSSGELDVTWGGPMRVIKDRADRPITGDSLSCFTEVVARDPFFLVGRADLGPFRLDDLVHLRMGSVSEVVTPWLCFQQDLRDAGIDPTSLNRVQDQSMQSNLDALRDGRLDVVQLFEPYVSIALREGFGQIVHTASERGPTSYTSLIATRDGIARNIDGLRAMNRAASRLRTWMTDHDAWELAAVVTPYFPQTEPALLLASMQRYFGAQIWATQPEFSRGGFARLAQSVFTGGLVNTLRTYEECVAPI